VGVKWRGKGTLSAGNLDMDAKELQRYRRLLVKKRQELLTESTGAAIPAAGRVEGDPVEQATAEAEAELKIQLHRTDGRLLRAIEEALGRINHRVYGLCESCKGPIAKVRLEAVPWTRHCRHCKEQEHSAA
jgi:DnaK suppressor protein